jgi:predicted dehydrogenase
MTFPSATFPRAMPTPRLPDPMAAPPLRWGVIGTGWIAERFTGALQRSTRQRVVAVGSRSVASAKDFADRVGAGLAHGSYADLVADPEVDVVYVATPHNLHHPHALLALDAGKHVLVEKPLALNAAQASEIAARASARGVFCAEALWTFFLPRYDVIRQLLDDGMLGDVRTVLADHGEWFPDTHRILRHDLAGGALLDLGTYPLAVASWVLGPPEEVHAIGQDVPGGEVHGQVSAVLRHAGGAQSAINTTVMADTPNRAVLAGTGATLDLEAPFYQPSDLVLTSAGKASTLRWTELAVGHEALYVTAVEAARRIAAGETGTPLRPLADSVATLELVDDIRRQIGVTFVEESAPGVPA